MDLLNLHSVRPCIVFPTSTIQDASVFLAISFIPSASTVFNERLNFEGIPRVFLLCLLFLRHSIFRLLDFECKIDV